MTREIFPKNISEELDGHTGALCSRRLIVHRWLVSDTRDASMMRLGVKKLLAARRGANLGSG
ncbi:hypothetical protein I6F07_12690 [Ensifer sp. IC4062]|nr:hypothetical protein [Ensifer sp. IC4062]MCA1441053.1 hypothetical protein [Ensifer sp. IC4062]